MAHFNKIKFYDGRLQPLEIGGYRKIPTLVFLRKTFTVFDFDLSAIYHKTVHSLMKVKFKKREKVGR